MVKIIEKPKGPLRKFIPPSLIEAEDSQQSGLTQEIQSTPQCITALSSPSQATVNKKRLASDISSDEMNENCKKKKVRKSIQSKTYEPIFQGSVVSIII